MVICCMYITIRFLYISLFFISYKSYFTYISAMCNCTRQFQVTAKAFGNATVTAHSVVTQHLNFFIAAALLLPSFYKRAVMKIYVQIIIGALFDIHFKNPLSRFCKQCLFKPFKTVRAAGFFSKICTLIKSTALYGIRCVLFRCSSFFFASSHRRYIQSARCSNCSRIAVIKGFLMRGLFLILLIKRYLI